MAAPIASIPEAFVRHTLSWTGPAGADWLARLPAIIAECAEAWSLTIGPPFPLSYNYVVAATRADGSPAVLKIGYPHAELFTEVEALRCFDGRGIAGLLEVDRERSAFLIERLEPGAPLTSVEDVEQATRIAARVMRSLWCAPPAEHEFPTVAGWGRGFARLRARFDGGTGPLPSGLVERAESLFADLLASSDTPMLLHGDLHHHNILSAGRAPWLAIDPKGLVGEPAYETGALLRNPWLRLLDMPDPVRLLARRIAILSEELGFDRRRVRDWAFAQAILSAWWSIEDHGSGWEFAAGCAEALAAAPI
jgi:streptomycin 6-kinase